MSLPQQMQFESGADHRIVRRKVPKKRGMYVKHDVGSCAFEGAEGLGARYAGGTTEAARHQSTRVGARTHESARARYEYARAARASRGTETSWSAGEGPAGRGTPGGRTSPPSDAPY